MEKQTVYKLDSKGKQREWSIWVEGDANSLDAPATIKMESGLVTGKKVPQEVVITSGKNLGKANATTPYTQAVSEAKAKLELQERSGYVKELSQVTQGVLRSGISAPMLAQKYHPTGEQSGSKTLAKMKIAGNTIHVQPKLDGNRAITLIEGELAEEQLRAEYGLNDIDGATGTMYTRKGDVMPVQLEGVISDLQNGYLSLIQMDAYNFTDLKVDGELFCSGMEFNELNGHLKRKSSQDAEKLAQVEYHVYDVMLPVGYAERRKLLVNLVAEIERLNPNTKVRLVPSYEIVATDENIKEKLEEFLAEGHEGLMIRTLDTPYENKRSWQLVKVKLFEDSEFEILDLEPDSMGRLGKILVKLDTPTVDRDGKEVNVFRAGLKNVSHEDGAKMLANKLDYVGKQATIEYFGRSEYGVPRFPKFKAVRD